MSSTHPGGDHEREGLREDRGGATQLTEDQRYVTQEEGTEPAYDNEYWANDEPGIYVDIVSRAAAVLLDRQVRQRHRLAELYQADRRHALDTRTDHQLVTPRIEVRSTGADSHLGHVSRRTAGCWGLRWPA